MERNIEKFAFNWRLRRALTSWQRSPDSQKQKSKMQREIDEMAKDVPLAIMIRKDKLGFNTEEGFMFPGVEKAYGEEDGRLIKFNTSRGLKMRVGEDRKRAYLFLEKDGQRLGFFRPGLVAKITVK